MSQIDNSFVDVSQVTENLVDFEAKNEKDHSISEAPLLGNTSGGDTGQKTALPWAAVDDMEDINFLVDTNKNHKDKDDVKQIRNRFTLKNTHIPVL